MEKWKTRIDPEILTDTQRKFVEYYVMWGDHVRAMEHAGLNKRYASRMLHLPKVQKAIKEAMDRMIDRLADRKDRMLQELDEIRELAKSDSKYAEALRAVELQMKHLGMLTEKVEQKVTHVNEEEIDERIKKFQALIGDSPAKVQ